jgi:hypothetical protein
MNKKILTLTSIFFSAILSFGQIITHQYDGNGRLIKTQEGDSAVSNYAIDPGGNITGFILNLPIPKIIVNPVPLVFTACTTDTIGRFFIINPNHFDLMVNSLSHSDNIHFNNSFTSADTLKPNDTLTIIDTMHRGGNNLLTFKDTIFIHSNARDTFEVIQSLPPIVPAQPGSISGSQTPCIGSVQTYSINSVFSATSYTWTLPTGWTGTSTTTSISVTVGSSNGNISVSASNACGTGSANTFAVTIDSIPYQPGNIAGDTTVCIGSVQTYSIVSVAGATDYIWTLPNGWTGTSSTSSITLTIGSSSGNIFVSPNYVCGIGSADTLAVTVISIPSAPVNISGDTSVCANSNQTYSIIPVSGATDYSWTLPNGWSGASTDINITVTIGNSGGNIIVIANNFCGSSTPQTLTVSIPQYPFTPDTIFGNSNPCTGSVQTYSCNNISGATSYLWSIPNNWSGTSTSNSITVTVGTYSGSINVIANNICGNNGQFRSINVNVDSIAPQPGIITGNSSVCTGSIQTYSINPVFSASSYTWTIPSDWSGTSTSTTITVTAGS